MNPQKDPFKLSRKFLIEIILKWLLLGVTVIALYYGVSHAWTGQWLDKCSWGLVLSMAGVVITFLFALPEPASESCDVRGLELGTELHNNGENILEGEKEKRIKHRKILRKAWAYVGLAYLLIGLVFQLIHQLSLQ